MAVSPTLVDVILEFLVEATEIRPNIPHRLLNGIDPLVKAALHAVEIALRRRLRFTATLHLLQHVLQR
jgi:hypothetical protein